MNAYHILILTFGAFLSIGYLNVCTSNDDFGTDVPRIWPNISDNGSFLQFPLPGLTGPGGLDISIYDIFGNVVKGVGLAPYLSRKSNFTLLQISIFGAVGAMLTGVASLIAEAAYFQHLDKEFKRRQDDFEISLPPSHLRNSFEPPAASRTSENRPSRRSPNRDYGRYTNKIPKHWNDKRRIPAKKISRRPQRNWSQGPLKTLSKIYNTPILPETRNRYDRRKVKKNSRINYPLM